MLVDVDASSSTTRRRCWLAYQPMLHVDSLSPLTFWRFEGATKNGSWVDEQPPKQESFGSLQIRKGVGIYFQGFLHWIVGFTLVIFDFLNLLIGVVTLSSKSMKYKVYSFVYMLSKSEWKTPKNQKITKQSFDIWRVWGLCLTGFEVSACLMGSQWYWIFFPCWVDISSFLFLSLNVGGAGSAKGGIYFSKIALMPLGILQRPSSKASTRNQAPYLRKNPDALGCLRNIYFLSTVWLKKIKSFQALKMYRTSPNGSWLPWSAKPVLRS